MRNNSTVQESSPFDDIMMRGLQSSLSAFCFPMPKSPVPRKTQVLGKTNFAHRRLPFYMTKQPTKQLNTCTCYLTLLNHPPFLIYACFHELVWCVLLISIVFHIVYLRKQLNLWNPNEVNSLLLDLKYWNGNHKGNLTSWKNVLTR